MFAMLTYFWHCLFPAWPKDLFPPEVVRKIPHKAFTWDETLDEKEKAIAYIHLISRDYDWLITSFDRRRGLRGSVAVS